MIPYKRHALYNRFSFSHAPFLRLASLTTSLLSYFWCGCGLGTSGVGSQNSIENVGAGIQQLLRDGDTLGVPLADQRY